MSSHASNLIAALHAHAPAVDRADRLQLYGQLIGDWETDIIAHAPDGTRHEGQGEIHFGWILEGRAIQAGNWYGTTIQVYDPRIDAWRIFWIDPATMVFRQQLGRARGPDIVQEGTTESGSISRWSFTKITPRSFHWLGEESTDGGASWRLIVEVLARRR